MSEQLRDDAPVPPRVEGPQVYRPIRCELCNTEKPFVIATKDYVRYYQCQNGDCGHRFKIAVQRPEEGGNAQR